MWGNNSWLVGGWGIFSIFNEIEFQIYPLEDKGLQTRMIKSQHFF
jgi:hypothetical protein